MLRLFGAIALCAIFPMHALAQGMTLQDAVHHALQRDLTVQQKAVALTQAQSALAKQAALTYPAINGSLQNFYQKSSNYGGSYALIGFAPQNVFSQNTAQISTQYTLTTGGLSLLQLDAQKAQVDQAASALKSAQNTVATTVTASFYAIAQKTALVAIDRSDLSYQHLLFLNAQAKERAGVAAGVDVLRAQVTQEKSQSTLVADQAAVQDARESLAQAIGVPIGTTFAVPKTIPMPPLPHGSLETLVAIAQASRPDVQSAQAAVRSAEFTRKGFDRALFPSTQITAGFGNQFSPTNAVLFNSLIPGKTRGSPGFWQIQAVSTFTLPLVDYGQRHTERANDDATLESARVTLDSTRNQTSLDVHQNYRAAQTTRSQLQYAQDESRLGVEAARIAQLQYQNGLIGLTDVSQAEQTSVTAQSDLINAQVAYVNAIVKLRTALGIYDAQSAVADLQ